MNKNKIKENKQSDSAEYNLLDSKSIHLPIYDGQKQNERVHLFTLGDPNQNSEFICLFLMTRARISESVILHRQNGAKL